MLEHAQYKDQTLAELYPWFLEEDESADPESDLFIPIGDRLLFASCGYSELYIDLKPSLLGVPKLDPSPLVDSTAPTACHAGQICFLLSIWYIM
jgi:hypothetical protein